MGAWLQVEMKLYIHYSKPNTASDLSTTFIYARLVLKPKFQTTSLQLYTYIYFSLTTKISVVPRQEVMHVYLLFYSIITYCFTLFSECIYRLKDEGRRRGL